MPNYLDDIYVVKLSYHLYELIYTLIFQKGRRDFAEINLHHFLTLILILYSYSTKFMPAGATIMFIHDITDSTVSIFKLCVDITAKWVQTAAYVLMLTSWVYFRLYIFPIHIIYRMNEEVSNSTHYV